VQKVIFQENHYFTSDLERPVLVYLQVIKVNNCIYMIKLLANTCRCWV